MTKQFKFNIVTASKLLLLLGLSSSSEALAASIDLPLTITYQGRLLDSTDTAISNTVDLQFDVFSEDGTCLLYSESKQLNLTNSDGFFSTQIGSVTGSSLRTSGTDPGLSMQAVFSNEAAITGASSCSYTPSARDGRKIQITIVKIGSTTVGTVLLPKQSVTAVPYATIAQTLQGKSADSFVQLTGAITQSEFEALMAKQAELLSLAAQETALIALANGTSTTYLKSALGGTNLTNTGDIKITAGKSLQFGSLDSTAQTTLVSSLTSTDIGKTWYNSSTNKLMYYDGTSAKTVSSGSFALNGLNTDTQTLAVGTSGTAPAWNSATSTHTLNIPLASTASVTAGLISNTEYTALASKAYCDAKLVSKNLAVPTASEDGKSIRWNNTSGEWEYFTPGASALASVSVTAPIASTGGTTPTLSLNVGAGLTTSSNNLVPDFGTASGKVAQGNDSRFNPAPTVGDAGKLIKINSGGTGYDVVANTDLSIDTTNHRVGIGIAAPSYDLSLVGTAAKTIGMERHSTADTAGNNMTMSAGGATSGATDKSGGKLVLSGGTSTGTGTSSIEFQTATAGSTGTSDNAPSTKMTILGNGNVGIGTTSPASKLHVSGGNMTFDSNTSSINLDTADASDTKSLRLSGGGAAADNSRGGHINLFGNENANGGEVAISAGNVATTGIVRFFTGTSEQMRISSSGNVGIGVTAPTAHLHLAAGTATANTAPFKFTSGTNLTTPEAGAMEFDGTSLYITDSSAVRRTLTTATSGSISSISSMVNASGNITLSPLTSTGAVLVDSGTASIGTTSGALVVTGGVGVSGAINAGGAIATSSTLTANGNISAISSTAATSGANASSPSIYLTSNYWNGSASAQDQWSLSNVLGTGSNPTSTLTFDRGSSYSSGTRQYAFLNGNVGIGSTPYQFLDSRTPRLQILGIDGATSSAFVGRYENGTDGATLYLGKSRGTTAGTHGDVASGDNIGIIRSGASFNSSYNYVADIMMGVDATPSAGIVPGNIQFRTTNAAGAITERMRIDSSGNVGIGTTAPGAPLEVDRSTTGDTAIFYSTVAGNDNVIRFKTNSNTSSVGLVLDNTSTNLAAGMRMNPDGSLDFNTGLASGGTLTNALEKMRIDSSGKVGIGTTAPTSQLTVTSNTAALLAPKSGNLIHIAAADSVITRATLDGFAAGPVIHLRRANNTAASPTALAADDYIGGLNMSGYDGSAFSNTRAAVGGYASEAWSASANGTYLVFSTTANGTTTSTERMRVDHAGYVGIGTTSPQTTLQVAGVISPATDNTYTLGSSSYRFTSIYATNATINTSDVREKKDILSSDLGLDFINQLRPVSYRWKSGADHEVHYGLIAQETEKVVKNSRKPASETSAPIVDHDTKTDKYGIRYTELIAPIIKALQELYGKLTSTEERVATLEKRATDKDRQIADLTAENARMKQENAAIKARLEKIEKLLQSR